MTRKYIIKAICPNCLGTGTEYYGGKKRPCAECKGTGEVERTVNEVESGKAHQDLD